MIGTNNCFWIGCRDELLRFDVNAPIADYFIVSGAPALVQIFIVIMLVVFNLLCAQKINKSMMRFSFGALFIYLNLLFIVPFFISHTNGVAGFASAHGVSKYGFSLTMFVLYILQLVLAPIVLLTFYSSSGRAQFVAQFRSKIGFSLFLATLIIYIVAYLIIVKPGIYLLLGDFQTAKMMRIAAVLGNTTEVTDAHKIFDYKNLFVWLLQGVVLSLYLASKHRFQSSLLIALFIILAFINFSKGALVGGLLMLIWARSFKSKELSYYPLILLMIISPIILVAYTYFFHASGIKLENAIHAIFRRFYNNSSSVYLQIQMFESLIPNFLYIQDWGKVGNILGLEPLIPKEMVYNEFYSGEGQGGSTFMSEIYFAFGWGGVLLIPLFLSPIVILDVCLQSFRSSTDYASRWVAGMLLFWGIIFTIGIQASPFKIINIFTVLRLEYIAIAFLMFLMVKIKVVKE